MNYFAEVLPALLIGISAGISPGPLSIFILSEAAAGRYFHSLGAALSPLISDGPIACAAFLFLALLPDTDLVYAILYGCGGIYLFYLSCHTAMTETSSEKKKSGGGIHHSVLKGAFVNLLNPNPYIFWLTVGGPSVSQLAQKSAGAAGMYVLLFYLGLIGTKGGVALAGIAGSKRTLSYKFPLKYVFAVLLLSYGCIFLYRSARLALS